MFQSAMRNQLELFNPPTEERASEAGDSATFEEVSLPALPDSPRSPARKDEGETPGGAESSAVLVALFPAELGGVISSTFRRMEIAEDEIRNAKRWHPRRHKELDAAFGALVPTEPLCGLADDLYRAHCRELLDRAAGKLDLRPGTAAEVVGSLAAASLAAPPTRIATLLYEDLFTSLFPENARSVLGCERVGSADSFEKAAARELDTTLRRKLAADRGFRRDRAREQASDYGVAASEAPALGTTRVVPVREVVIRYRGPRYGASERIGTPDSAVAFASQVIQDDAREHFLAIHLDARHRAIGHQIVSVGTATASLVHPRELFQPAVLLGAVAVIVLHNHPSGDPTPSQEDRALTRRLCDAGRLIGIPILDHVVWARPRRFVSLREEGEVPQHAVE